MAYLNQSYSAFIQHYLQRCSQVQEAADSDPKYQQINNEPPVIVLDDDEDEAQRRTNSSQNRRLDAFASASTTFDNHFEIRRQRTNGHFVGTPESSDLHITGVSVLREWIDISELDLRKYANLYNSKEKTLDSEVRKNGSRESGENGRCNNGRTPAQASNNNVEIQNGGQREENERSKNCTTLENQSTCNKIAEGDENERKKENKNGNNNLLKQILQGKKYTNSKIMGEDEVIVIDPESSEPQKPTVPQESVLKTDESDMTWADLNVEEDIEPDEEKDILPEVQDQEEVAEEVQDEETQTIEENESSEKYKCSHCSYRTAWKSNLTKHVVSRHKSSEEIHWYQCAHCPYKGKTREYLRVHLRLNHEQFITWHACAKCPFRCKSKQLLQAHVLSLHTAPEDIKWFECEQCDFRCKFKQRLKCHRINRHMGEGEVRWFACQECDYRAKIKKSLRKHVLNKHTDYDQIQWLRCDKCEYECKENSKLNAHVRTCHSEEAEARREAEEELECGMCGFKTRSKGEFQEHCRFNGPACFWMMRST